MKKACEALQEKRLISDLSISVRVERTSDWSRNWERKVSGASLVMIHLMKNALKSSFWKDCKNFLDQNHIAYFVDAIDGDMAEHSASIDGDVLETFRKYCLYGGLSNFKICGCMQMDSLIIRQKKLHRRRSTVGQGSMIREQRVVFRRRSRISRQRIPMEIGRCWGCFFTEMSGSGMIPRM